MSETLDKNVPYPLYSLVAILADYTALIRVRALAVISGVNGAAAWLECEGLAWPTLVAQRADLIG
ncbi:hypothetical protein ADN00_00655 [Ornatilinea apprima]|uniref:Uncharacterized protein n=1 Tax=Ornatilinea apprima TaxID=1134406 RepID=A0A0N8GPJ5_9CHLR|nr:hypothetical protein ADN00_00655 [Ornatilinea apprima]